MQILHPSPAHEPAARLPEPPEDYELALEEDRGADDTDHTHSVATIVCNDHDRIKGLWRRYKDPSDSPHERELLVMQLLRELSVHMGAEEAVLYPAVAEYVDEHMRDHAADEHESLNLFARDLEAMMTQEGGEEDAAAAGQRGPGHAAFEDKLHQLIETFLEHTYEEEHRMLPALRDALEERQLCELGTQFEAAKRHLPTRPHPVNPKHPHVDDATVLADAARDAAAFGGTPPPLGTASTQVLRPGSAEE